MHEPSRSGWARRIVALTILGIGVSLPACGTSDGEVQGGAGRSPREGGRGAALPVRAGAVERGDITAFIETHARLEAERWVEVVARAEGIAQALSVDEGDAVEAGQLLVQLEKSELTLDVQQARVARDLAEANFERARALRDRQVVTLEEFQNAENQLENATVALDQAELRLTYADIRSPIDGVVMQRHVESGDLVAVNDVVFVVADLEPLKARIHVPEKRMGQVHPGQEAYITVDPVPDRTFPATVRMINPGVDPATGTVKVTLDVPPTDGVLKPGMFSAVRIVTERRTGVLIVPKKALVLETDEDDVFTIKEGRAVRTRIGIGFTDGDRVEVRSGLNEGDRVITVGHEGLNDGAAVREVGPEGVDAGASRERPGSSP